MAKNKATPLPTSIDDDESLPWDKPAPDAADTELWDDADDADVLGEAETEAAIDAHMEAAEAEERPLREVLSAIGRQGLSSRMQNRPLSAQSNDWLRITAQRLNGLLLEHPANPEAAQWRKDVALLEAAAKKRSGEAPASERAKLAAPATTAPDARWREDTIQASIERSDTVAVIMSVPIADIAPDPEQARDEGADDELADAIKANGFYPAKAIEIREHPRAGGFQINAETAQGISHPAWMIVDGERRWRAARKAGLTHVPATVTANAVALGDRLVRQVVSNDSKRLKPMEEARTFKRIMADKGWTAQQLADHLGRKKSTVGDRLALLEVPVELVKYFEEGILGVAAAPILRPIAGLPERARKRVVESFLDNGDFKYYANQAREDGKAMPLHDVEQEVAGALHDELREIDPEACGDYHGKIVNVGKASYAVDVAAYDAAVKRAAAAAPKPKTSTASTPAVTKPIKEKPSTYQLAERKRAADARKKAALRRAHFSALAAKLPTSLDAKWALFVIEHLLIEMHNDSRRAVYQALVVPGPVASSVNINKELKTFAADQDSGGRVRMIIQLLLGNDLVIGSWDSSGAKRIAAAAALAKFDLKKVNVNEPEFSAGAKKLAHSLHAKKKARR